MIVQIYISCLYITRNFGAILMMLSSRTKIGSFAGPSHGQSIQLGKLKCYLTLPQILPLLHLVYPHRFLSMVRCIGLNDYSGMW